MTGAEVAVAGAVVGLLHELRHLIKDVTYRNRLAARRRELDIARESLDLLQQARRIDPLLAAKLGERLGEGWGPDADRVDADRERIGQSRGYGARR
jgi:hypothetical protein